MIFNYFSIHTRSRTHAHARRHTFHINIICSYIHVLISGHAKSVYFVQLCICALCSKELFIHDLNRHNQLSSVTFSLLYKICLITTLHRHRQFEHLRYFRTTTQAKGLASGYLCFLTTLLMRVWNTLAQR